MDIIRVTGNWIPDPLKGIIQFLGSPRIGSSSSVYLLRLTVELDGLATIFLSPEWDSFYFCGHCTTYFSDYSLSNLQSSVECLGTCTNHVFATVVR